MVPGHFRTPKTGRLPEEEELAVEEGTFVAAEEGTFAAAAEESTGRMDCSVDSTQPMLPYQGPQEEAAAAAVEH